MVLCSKGWQRLQEAQNESERLHNGGNPYTVEQLAELTELSLNTLGRVRTQSSPVDKRTLETYFDTFGLTLTPQDYISPSRSSEVLSSFSSVSRYRDWGDAVDVSMFHGRTHELKQLKHCILEERCRLVSVLGVGGIGKTTLSVQLAKQIQDEFDFIIWRSLRNAPAIQDLLSDLLTFLAYQQDVLLPNSVDGKILQVLDCLRENRCLLLLDNFESVLQSGDRTGRYLDGYERYGQLLRSIGETVHQSVLILTSRERPKGVGALEGGSSPIRSLGLKGLSVQVGDAIFRSKGAFIGSESDLAVLIKYYSGNPLALKIVASTVRELFDSNLSNFLQFMRTDGFICDDIGDLLEPQIQRLTALEREIMIWLAINHKPVSYAVLQEDLLLGTSLGEITQALSSLKRRALVETHQTSFTQQPVVTEYIISQLVDNMSEEILSGEFNLFNQYLILKAQEKDYIKDAQILFIVQPIIQKLQYRLGSKRQIIIHLSQVITSLRQNHSLSPGYVAGNICNILCQLWEDLGPLCQLQGNLITHDFSDLTIWQADFSGIELHHVNFTGSDLAKSLFADRFGLVCSAAFSPDGNLLATAGDCGIWIWQVSDMSALVTCEILDHWVFDLAFSPDSQMLACADGDGQAIWLWDVKTGECLNTFNEHHNRTWSVSFSTDGRTLATASGDRTIKLWDISSGQCLRTLTSAADDRLKSIAFSSDGQLLVSAGDGGIITLWNLLKGQKLKVFQDSTRIRRIIFSPDGQALASVGEDAQIKLWDVTTGQIIQIFQGHTYFIRSAQFHPNGQVLASCSYDQTIKLWDVGTGKCINTLRGHTSCVWAIAFSPDGQLLASGSDDQTIRLWQTSTGQCLRTKQGSTRTIWQLAFGPDSHLLASAHEDYAIRVWDSQTGDCIKTLRGQARPVFGISYCSDSQRLASCGGSIQLWNVHTGECLNTLDGHTNMIWSVTFSPDGELLASGSADRTVKLWNPQTGICVRTFEGHKHYVWSVVFSPDGQILGSSGEDTVIRLWNPHTGDCLRCLDDHSHAVWSIAFSPDGTLLASASFDGTAKLWSVATGECLNTFSGHQRGVRSVAFSPDGCKVVTGSDDFTLKTWDVLSGECLETLQGHTGLIWSVVFAPNGRLIASGGADEQINLWNNESDELLQSLKVPRRYEGSDITGATGLTQAQKNTLKALGAVERIGSSS